MVRLRMTAGQRARLLVLLGATAIVIGAGLMWEPLGWIAAGVALVLIGLYLVDVEDVREPGTARPFRSRR